MAGGAILAIQPILLPFLAAIFLLCLLPTGMVSLGSIVMAASYPVLTLLYGLLKGLAVGDLAVCVAGAASWAAWSSICTVPISSASAQGRSTASAGNTKIKNLKKKLTNLSIAGIITHVARHETKHVGD